jgi:hypothetical protein
MKLALAAIVVSALLGLAGSASAADNLTYGCEPPPTRTMANCSAWNTRPVTLVWSWTLAYDPAPIPGSDCTTPRIFSADTAGTQVHCYIWKHVDQTGVEDLIATIRIDMTSPTVTGMTPARPPDHDGWWNHPVALSFAGTDATSGIATCDTITYSGPDSATAQVTGTCTDVAGNTSPGTYPLKYDGTPPTVAPGAAGTTVGQVSIGWLPSADVVSSRVIRSPGIGGAPASEIYSGPNHSLTDSAVTGGETYTYSIIAADPAGNEATTTMAVKAKATPQASPAAKNALRAPRLDWQGVKGADYYNVQLFRNGRKILSAWPRFSRLQLHKQWRYAGKKRKLAPGTYHWYVWPGYGGRAAHRYGKLIAQKRFKIAAPPASGKAASRG